MRIRPVIALDPRYFGRRAFALSDALPHVLASAIGSDLKLFASTFAAGFLFVSIFLS